MPASALTEATPSVLLIEDDASLAEMYSIGLRGHGYQVIPVATARDGVREAVDVGPDFAVIDIGLPDGSGLDVLAALGVRPGIPPLVAIVFTNFDDPNMRTSATLRGAAAYLVKASTTPAQLASVLKELKPN